MCARRREVFRLLRRLHKRIRQLEDESASGHRVDSHALLPRIKTLEEDLRRLKWESRISSTVLILSLLINVFLVFYEGRQTHIAAMQAFTIVFETRDAIEFSEDGDPCLKPTDSTLQRDALRAYVGLVATYNKTFSPEEPMRVGLARARLSGLDLQGEQLPEADLREACLEGANLAGANLKGAVLANIHGSEASLPGAYLQGANLEGAKLDQANLIAISTDGDTIFKGAKLRGAVLVAADLHEAKAENADISGAYLDFYDSSKLSQDEDRRLCTIFNTAKVFLESTGRKVEWSCAANLAFGDAIWEYPEDRAGLSFPEDALGRMVGSCTTVLPRNMNPGGIPWANQSSSGGQPNCQEPEGEKLNSSGDSSTQDQPQGRLSPVAEGSSGSDVPVRTDSND